MASTAYALQLRARERSSACSEALSQRSAAQEFLARLVVSSQADEEVAANAGQPVVAAQRGFIGERVHKLHAGLWAERHRHCHGAVELYDGGPGERRETVVQRHDSRPVGLLDAARPCMAAGNGALQRVRAQRAAELLGSV